MPPNQKRREPRVGKPAGTPADRLIRAWTDGREEDFETAVEGLLSGEQSGAIDVAVRRVSERYDEEAARDFSLCLLEVAEVAETGPSGWAELILLPALLGEGAPSDPAPIAASLPESGVFPTGVDASFSPEWRSASRLLSLPPVALRRVLIDLVEGRPAADLPPADPEELAAGGMFLLLGHLVDWREEPPQEDEEAEAARMATEHEAHLAAFEAWRTAVLAGGLSPPVMLPPVPPSAFEDEVAASFADETDVESGWIDEIRDFVEMARAEAPGEEVVCRQRLVADGWELTLATAAGRTLDSRVIARDGLPASPDELARLLGTLVTVVEDLPGVEPPKATATSQVPPRPARLPGLRLVGGRR